ncbi:pathogen-associated molecular patterns-induced protein A70-like [Phragmites australis]|uniref:pathogen-associated molecular patterns-induced protein A70-like n=1 Tax=Phragmites australis TaxID=29695 RepID=UPI002D798584|nr:pathogen-associated molecular patterns-induced protein A70-like [Phragmites australis]
MDSADAMPSGAFGAWSSVRSFFTPAMLFLVVNLVIGTIALTSRATHKRLRRDHQHDAGHNHHLQEPLHPHQQEYHYYQQQPQYATPPEPAPAPLARTSSVLDRLRSFGLYRFRPGDFPPEYGAGAAGENHAQDVFSPVEEETTKQAHCTTSQSEPAPAREAKRPATRMKKSGSEVRKAPVARAPARVIEEVAEDEAVDARTEDFIDNFRRGPEEYYQEKYVRPAAPAPLARTSSMLDRLRSLGLYGFLAPEHPAAASAPARDVFAIPADEKKQAHAHCDRSRSEPGWEQGKKEKKQGAEATMAKSSSVARKPASRSPVEEEADKCVDARAEAFIDSFRQQQVHHYEEEYVPPPAPAPLSRTPSVLERLRSFGLYRFRSGDLGPELPVAESTPAADENNRAHYGRSRSEPAREQGKKEARMSKSSSQAAAPITVEEEADEGVDARADDFISKFRQQLQLQRLNSLLNYK